MNSLICILSAALLVSASHGYPMPQPNVVGYTSRTVYTPGMEHPMQTYNVEYSMPMDTNTFYAGSYYPAAPQPMPAVHDRQRRQIGLGGGMGGGMGGAQAQAQAQSQSMGAGMGLGGMGGFGGMGINPYMMGYPFMG